MSKFNTIRILGEDGLPHALHFVDGAYAVVAMDMEYSIAMGLCTDKGYVSKFGANAAIPNGSYEPVWEGSSTPYDGFDDSMALEVLSSSADDTAAGVGARTIRVHGLEATTFAEKTADYTLNGVTAVAMGNWARVNRVYPLTHGGSGGIFGDGGVVGTLTVRKTGPGSTVAIVTPTYNQTEMAIWTCPAGKRAVLSSWYAGTPEASKSFEVQLVRRNYGDGGWRAADSRVVAQGTIEYHLDTVIEEKGDVMVIASGTGTTGKVFAGFRIVYEDIPV